MANCKVLLLLVCLGIYKIIGSLAQSDYTTRLNSLFTSLSYGYNAVNRPDKTVQVAVSLELLALNGLNSKTGELSITGSFIMSWTDSQYVWDKANYDNIEYLFLSKDYCWKPHLIVDNSIADVAILHDDSQIFRVRNDGTVLWEAIGEFTVTCDVDLAKFPFDRQKCFISLSNLVFGDTEVKLSHFYSSIKTENVVSNSEWDISKSSTSNVTTTDGRGRFSRTSLRFHLEMERNSSFYIWNVVVPYILLSSIGLLVFLLPSKNTDKIGFSSTVLLIEVIFFLMFSTFMPITQETFPTIGVYFLVLLLSNIMELIMTVVIARMHQNDHDENPVSDSLQRFSHILLSRISCFVCCREREYQDTDYTPKRKKMPMNTRISPAALHSSIGNSSPPSHRPPGRLNDFDRIKSAVSTRTTSDIDTSTVTTESSNMSSTAPLQSQRQREYSWREIISMVNLLCFMLFLLLFLIETSVCFAIIFSK